MQTQDYIRLSTYARRYDVSTKTVRKWADSGIVSILKIGRLWRVLNVPPNTRSSAVLARPVARIA